MVKLNFYKTFRVTHAEVAEFNPEDFRVCEPQYNGNTNEDFLDFILNFADYYSDEENEEVCDKYNLDEFFNFENEFTVDDDESPDYDMKLTEPDSWDEDIFNTIKAE